jgi:hypothetical protein
VQEVLKYIGPTFRPVDLFLWYIYPNTQLEVSDATLIFEDMMVDKSQVEVMGETPIDPQVEVMGETPIDPREPDLGMIFENIQPILDKMGTISTPEARDKFDIEERRLAAKGLASKMDVPEDKNRPLDVTKCHWKRDLDGTGDHWWQIIIGADEVPLQVRREPFWMDEPPYLVGKFVETLDCFYGEGFRTLAPSA